MLLNHLLELKQHKYRSGVYVFFPQTHTSCPGRVDTHPLDALFIDTDAPEQGFKDFAECEGEESNGAELQAVSHLLQDGGRLLLDVINSSARLSANL